MGRGNEKRKDNVRDGMGDGGKEGKGRGRKGQLPPRPSLGLAIVLDSWQQICKRQT